MELGSVLGSRSLFLLNVEVTSATKADIEKTLGIRMRLPTGLSLHIARILTVSAAVQALSRIDSERKSGGHPSKKDFAFIAHSRTGVLSRERVDYPFLLGDYKLNSFMQHFTYESLF